MARNTCSVSTTVNVIFTVFTLLDIFIVNCEDVVKIKIVDAPALTRFSSPSSSQQLTLRMDPSNLTGPPHLCQLNGTCFEGTERGYKYKVCPFQNVTQQEERRSWMSYHGVLGVWKDWIVENDTFIGLHFIKGEQCGAVDREAKVMFNCSTKTRIHNVTEPSTCSYIIWLDSPLACFKGAMQVYQMLNKKQLEEWEKADYEYYSNEITFQGLTKRRSSILVDAGVHAPPPNMQPDTKVKTDEGNLLTVDGDHKSDDKSNELLQCQQENEALQKKLRELEIKISNVAKAHSNVAALLVSNNTVTMTSNNTNAEASKVPGSDIEEHKSRINANNSQLMETSPKKDR